MSDPSDCPPPNFFNLPPEEGKAAYEAAEQEDDGMIGTFEGMAENQPYNLDPDPQYPSNMTEVMEMMGFHEASAGKKRGADALEDVANKPNPAAEVSPTKAKAGKRRNTGDHGCAPFAATQGQMVPYKAPAPALAPSAAPVTLTTLLAALHATTAEVQAQIAASQQLSEAEYEVMQEEVDAAIPFLISHHSATVQRVLRSVGDTDLYNLSRDAYYRLARLIRSIPVSRRGWRQVSQEEEDEEDEEEGDN